MFINLDSNYLTISIVVAVSSRMNFSRQVTVCFTNRHKETTTIIVATILESSSLEHFILTQILSILLLLTCIPTGMYWIAHIKDFQVCNLNTLVEWTIILFVIIHYTPFLSCLAILTRQHLEFVYCCIENLLQVLY